MVTLNLAFRLLLATTGIVVRNVAMAVTVQASVTNVPRTASVVLEAMLRNVMSALLVINGPIP